MLYDIMYGNRLTDNTTEKIFRLYREDHRMANWIIVIDDDAATLKLAGHLLSKAGYRVTALKSGRLALD